MTELLEKHKTIVRRWVKEVFNEHNLDAVEELKVHEYIDWNSYPGQNVALEGFKSVLMAFFAAFPDFRYDVEMELAEGDLLVCLGTWSGTQSGHLMGIPPTGKRMSARRVDIVRFSGDKMSERWGTGNELKMLQLMGICASVEPPADQHDNTLIARRFVEEVLNQRKPAAIEMLVDGNGAHHTKGSLALFLTAAAFTDSRITIDEVRADRDAVTALLTFSGMHTGDFMGFVPTGKQVMVKQILHLRMADSKIVEGSYDANLSSIVQQISA